MRIVVVMPARRRTSNRAKWDERAPAHAASPDYGVARFAADPDHFSGVVAFDRPLLGTVAGLRGVHLQCHIGTDTVSLARLGAHMTGLDFSAPALAAGAPARRDGRRCRRVRRVRRCTAPATCCRRVVRPRVHGHRGDIWLPAIDRWAGVVAGLLAPGGRLFIREGHPILYATAEPLPDGLLVLEHPYFEHADPTMWDADGTYVRTDVTFEHTRSAEWNHGLGEIVTALLDHGLELTALVEHDSVPWDALPGQMEEIGGGEWRLRDRPERLPHTFTVTAVKRR